MFEHKLLFLPRLPLDEVSELSHVRCLVCYYIQNDGKAFQYILKNNDLDTLVSYVCCF